MTDSNTVERHLALTRRVFTPSADLQQRVLVKLDVNAAARSGMSAATAQRAAAPSAWRSLRASGKLGAGVGGGLVALGFIAGVLVNVHDDAPPPPLPPVQVGRVLDAEQVVSAPLVPDGATAAEDERSAEPLLSRSAASASGKPRAMARTKGRVTNTKPPAMAKPSNARDELELLRRAERAVRADNSALALVLTSEHEARYPSSPLGEERSAIELMAHCAAKASDGAARAARFVRQHPKSLYLGRISELCVVDASAVDAAPR